MRIGDLRLLHRKLKKNAGFYDEQVGGILESREETACAEEKASSDYRNISQKEEE